MIDLERERKGGLPMQCPKCRAAMPNGAKYSTECGPNPPRPARLPPPRPPARPRPPPPRRRPPPMRRPRRRRSSRTGWKEYIFIFLFALGGGAIVNLIDSLQFFTGSILGDDVEILYAYYPLLKVLNLAFALILVTTQSSQSTRATGWRSSAKMDRPAFMCSTLCNSPWC